MASYTERLPNAGRAVPNKRKANVGPKTKWFAAVKAMLTTTKKRGFVFNGPAV